MDDTQRPQTSSSPPLLPRLVIWVLLGVLLAFQFWPKPRIEYRWGFHVAGNRTNLYVAKTGEPAAAESELTGQIVFTQTDAMGGWSDPVEAEGRVLSLVAWQEDLVALFAEGGLFQIGPSQTGYVSPPRVPGGPAMRWWLAAAADGPTLHVLGLDVDGNALTCRRGADAWGDLETVNLKTDWTRDIASEMVAAVRGEELHVLWPSRAVTATPTGQGPGQRWLMYARRDASRKWHGPFEDKDILLDGPVRVAPYGDRLAMIFRHPAEGDDQPAALTYAEYTPADGRWHTVRRDIALPANDEDEPPEVADYGFAQFGDGHVLAVNTVQGDVMAYHISLADGGLEPMTSPPALEVTPPSDDEIGTLMNWVLLAFLAAAVVMFIMSQVAQRRLLRQRLADGSLPREEVARMISDQVERLMYMPVLFRRGVAAMLDVVISGIICCTGTLVAVMQAYGLDLEAANEKALALLTSHTIIIYVAMLGSLVLYHTICELIWQRTLGKRLLGLRVVDLDGGRPAWWRIVVRNLLRPVDHQFGYMIALFAVVWSRRNQSVGDMAGGTRVVRDTTQTSGEPHGDDTDVA